MHKRTGPIGSSGIYGQNPGYPFWAAAMDPDMWTEKLILHRSTTGTGGLPKTGNPRERPLSRKPEERPCGREA